MRCIETIYHLDHQLIKLTSNRHMRCIETVAVCDFAKLVMIEPTHEMYWNFPFIVKSPVVSNRTDTWDVLKQFFWPFRPDLVLIEPTHEMYWNSPFLSPVIEKSWIEPTHEMYWNIWDSARAQSGKTIEPTHEMYWNHKEKIVGLLLENRTDTWDVLKPIHNG